MRCNVFNGRCTQGGRHVLPPRAGATCGSGGGEWRQSTGPNAVDVYRCGGDAG